jgi:2-polyprenyl-6-methoxyphenol hydroxylase-like FAD-dependent oxidoreductase
MRIAIVGHGIAGAALARLLAMADHHISCFERQSQASKPGAGLLLQPMGLAVLDQIGLLEQAYRLGAPVAGIESFADDGRRILDLRYPTDQSATCGLGVQHSALQQLLRTAASPAADVRYDCSIESVDARHGYLHCVDGSLHGPFGLIVGADGRHSSVRAAVPGACAPLEYRWGGLLCMLDDWHGIFDGRLVQRYRGKYQLAVWPLGASQSDDRRRVNLSWRVDTSHANVLDLAGWKRQVTEIEPRLELMLSQLHSVDQLLSVRYARATRSTWGIDRLVLIGDAAHCMSPQLGQGASLALLDALVLARCLTTERCVDQVRACFRAAREPQIRRYRRLSRVLTPLYQSAHPLPRWLRERVIPLLARAQPFRLAMSNTLTGATMIRHPGSPQTPQDGSSSGASISTRTLRTTLSRTSSTRIQ